MVARRADPKHSVVIFISYHLYRDQTNPSIVHDKNPKKFLITVQSVSDLHSDRSGLEGLLGTCGL